VNIVREDITRAIEDIPTLDRRDAARLADEITDAVIEALRRDRAIPSRTFNAWAVVLADIRHRVTDQINLRISGRVNVDEVIALIESAF
jgi:hypothetical protein